MWKRINVLDLKQEKAAARCPWKPRAMSKKNRRKTEQIIAATGGWRGRGCSRGLTSAGCYFLITSERFLDGEDVSALLQTCLGRMLSWRWLNDTWKTLVSTKSEERDPSRYMADRIFVQSPSRFRWGKRAMCNVCLQDLSQTDGRNLGFYVAKVFWEAFLLQQTVKGVCSLGVGRWVPASSSLVWGFASSLSVMSARVRVFPPHWGGITADFWNLNWKLKTGSVWHRLLSKRGTWSTFNHWGGGGADISGVICLPQLAVFVKGGG